MTGYALSGGTLSDGTLSSETVTEGAATLTLSVVVPVYNEADNVVPLLAAIAKSLRKSQVDYEVVLVSDGSTDGTWETILQAHELDKRVRGVELSRNFGHQHALLAGYQRARGRAVVSMDGDLQHPPEVLPLLVERWRDGYKVVSTRREDHKGASLFKRSSSRAFYRLFSRLTGVPLSAGSSDFRLLDRCVVTELLRVNDLDIFLRGLVPWLGFKATVVSYRAAERFAGQSKYGLGKMIRFALTAITSFSVVPLRLGIWLGFLTSALAFFEFGYIVRQYLSGQTVPGWASMMTIVSLMFGVLFVLLGIIGIYLGKVYELLKGRPRFIIGSLTDDAEGKPSE